MMNIVIIEDEPLTAEELADTILEVDDRAQVAARLGSIKESIDYFSNNDHPDLIFSDIQLSDGLCFELFQKMDITVHVIFCTAYNEYAIQAFKDNGIDYSVNSFTQITDAEEMKGYQTFKDSYSMKPDPIPYDALMDILEKKNDHKHTSL